MAVTDAYADATAYKALIARADGLDDTEIDADLLSASRDIDMAMGRFFTKDETAQPRIYYPAGYFAGDPEAENPWKFTRGSRSLYVDEFASITGLVIKIDEDRDGSFADETALATTDYELRPLNADKGPQPRPWREIVIPVWSTKSGWPTGSPVQVTAIWGWPAIPTAVSRATIRIAAIRRFESPLVEPGDTEGALSAERKVFDELARSHKRSRIVA